VPLYTAATKTYVWKNNTFSTTAGYGIDVFEKNQYEGLFGGVSFSPCFFRPFSLLAEYDTKPGMPEARCSV